MKFTLRNVGPIREAHLELARLTIVCGPNNVGKTYLTNGISDFYRRVSKTCRIKVSEQFLPDSDVVSVDLSHYVHSVVDEVRQYARKYTASSPLLRGGSLEIELDPAELPIDYPVPQTTWSMRIGGGAKFEVLKKGYVLTIKRRADVKEGDLPDEKDKVAQWQAALNVIVNANFFKQTYNGGVFSDVFPVTSERMGIVYFRDALDMAARTWRRGESDEKVEVSNEKMAQNNDLFPANVKSMLDFISWLGQRERLHVSTPNAIDAVLQESLIELSGGGFSVEDGRILYAPSDRPELKLNVQEISSSARSLFFLDEYIRSAAEKGDLLVIDEPEMNLHPSKVRKLARFVAKAVNAGLKAFITTHSDYFIRELNTLIMLRDDDARMKEVSRKYGYESSELLSVKDVKGYVLADGVLKSLPLSQEAGFEVASFDESARAINAIQSEILFGGGM